MNVNTSTVKKLAYIFSPCVILAIFFVVIGCIYAVEPGEHGEARAYMVYAILLMLPFLIVSLIIDCIIRICLKKAKVKKKTLYLWGIEVIVVVLLLGFIFGFPR